MASKRKTASMSSRASKAGIIKGRPCPSACGFFLSETDTHEACPVCLGMLHARAALANPESCVHCHRLRKSTLERRVSFLSKVLGSSAAGQDPLLSQAAESSMEAGQRVDEEEDGLIPSWGEQMDTVLPLSELEVMQEDPSGFTVENSEARVFCDDEISLTASGTYSEEDTGAVCEEESEELAQALGAVDVHPEADGSTPALFELCRRAAVHLDVSWPASPPLQQQTRLAGKYFLPQPQSTVKHKLPIFPDFVTELTRSWSSPKAPASLPFTQFLDLEGMETAGLTNIPPMDETLAYHLAPKANMASNKPALPSKQCRFSASQLEKIYRAQGLSARALNTASMLQAYQAEKLQDLHHALSKGENATAILDEVRRTADFILRLSSTAASALGKGMAETVVAQRHLWLTLTELPDGQRSEFLYQPVEPFGLFGHALEKIQTRCDLRKKQEEALCFSLPRRYYPQPKSSSDISRSRSLTRRIAPKRPSPEESIRRRSVSGDRQPQPQVQPKQSSWTKQRFVPRQAAAPRPSAAERRKKQPPA